MSVRDWMIIIGLLLIVAVLLDGYRRMRDPRRIRVSLKRVPDGPEADKHVSSELPNGGARVLNRDGAAAEPVRADAAGAAEVDDEAAEAVARTWTCWRKSAPRTRQRRRRCCPRNPRKC